MTTAIRVCPANLAKIEEALKAVNGRARDHAYSEYYEISDLAAEAEAKVTALVGATKRAVGASVSTTSGGAVNNTYAKKCFRRTATRVALVRRATGWFMTAAVKTEIYQHGGGAMRITLTPAQAESAVASFKAKFSVMA